MSNRFNYRALQFDINAIMPTLHLTGVTLEQAKAVRRDIARHHTLQERFCDGFRDWQGNEDTVALKRAEGRERGVEKRLKAIFGDRVSFCGDPRGGTVKIKYDGSERLNYFTKDWGGDYIYEG